MKTLMVFVLSSVLISCESPNSPKNNLPAVEKTTITTQWLPHKYKLDEWEDKKVECVKQIRKVIDDFRQHKNAVVEFNYRGVMYVDKSEDTYQCTDGDGTVVLTYNENTTRLLKPHPVERL